MKKIIVSAAIALSTLLGMNGIAKASEAVETTTVLNDVKNIHEIEVHGNVQVYLTSGNTEQVKVYDDYYAGSALVQEQDNVLRITSYNAKPLVVWVTVADLAKLSAFDNASISSFGKLSALDLSVSLSNQAVAKLDMDAVTASIQLNDRASADLTGYVENGSLNYDASASFNTGKLTAANLTQMVMPAPVKHIRHMRPSFIVG